PGSHHPQNHRRADRAEERAPGDAEAEEQGGGRAHQRELAGAVCREAHVAHHDDRRDRPGEHPQQQGREDGLLHEIHVQQGEGVRPPLAGVKLAHRTITFPSTSMTFTSVWYSSERVSVFMTSATVPCRCPCGVM